jgi:glycine hydroxymethyltransferase
LVVAAVTGGTATHLALLDLRTKNLTGNIARSREHHLQQNGVPFDPQKPTVTSSVRLGTPAGTTRGFGVAEFREVGRMIAEVLDGLAVNGETGSAGVEVEVEVKARAIALCERFPIY